MDPVMLALATSLLSAMVTDGWQQARAATLDLWRRRRPEEADAVAVRLAEARAQVLAARQSHDVRAEQVLAADWGVVLQRLVLEDPDLVRELRLLLNAEAAAPASSAPLEAGEAGNAVRAMKAKASGHGRVYQAGRDQHITESSES